jgi:hypothetical protein
MRLHKQKFPHIPQAGIFGDCFRTALACILDMEVEEVPHFLQIYHGGSAEARDSAIEKWLNTRGYSNIVIPYQVIVEGETLYSADELMCIIANQNGDDLLYLLTGRSISETDHVVICRGPKIFWDPSPSNSGVVAPSNGFYFVTHILPSSMRLSQEEADRLVTIRNNMELT